MTQPRKLSPTTYIPTGLYSLDGWPTLPVAAQTASEPSLLSRMASSVSRFLFDTTTRDGLVPNRSAA